MDEATELAEARRMLAEIDRACVGNKPHLAASALASESASLRARLAEAERDLDAVRRALGAAEGDDLADVVRTIIAQRDDLVRVRDGAFREIARETDLRLRAEGVAGAASRVLTTIVARHLADHVIGCVRCAYPAALVGEEIPGDGLCAECRAKASR